MQKNNKKELLENIYGIWNCSVERKLLMYWLKLDKWENEVLWQPRKNK